MAQKVINVRVELETAIDLDLDQWSRDEGRSKRRHVAILIRKLTGLRKTHPQDLQRLGLIDRVAIE